MEENNRFNVERSLEIIQQAIEQSRRDLAHDSGTPMVMWGGLSAVMAVVVGTLWMLTGEAYWNCLWFVIGGVEWVYLAVKMKNKKKDIKPETFFDKALGCIWSTFGVACFVVIFLNLLGFYMSADAVRIPITPTIMLLLSFSTVITGFILRLRESALFIAGSIVLIAFAIFCPGPSEMFVFALHCILLLVFPGLIINSKVRRGLL